MIPSKEKVVSELEKYFDVNLLQLLRKRIFYEGKLKSGNGILVCTPQSKLYPAGHGWVDITTIQYEMLDKADVGILAIRLEGNSVYYVCFKDFKKYLSEKAMVNNDHEGDHWKMYLLTDRIKVLNNNNHFLVKPNNLEGLISIRDSQS